MLTDNEIGIYDNYVNRYRQFDQTNDGGDTLKPTAYVTG